MSKPVDKNIRKLQKLGKTSLAVTIPKEIVNELRWREKQSVKVTRIKGGFMVRDCRRSKNRYAVKTREKAIIEELRKILESLNSE